jgi:hypothetical protein
LLKNAGEILPLKKQPGLRCWGALRNSPATRVLAVR